MIRFYSLREIGLVKMAAKNILLILLVQTLLSGWMIGQDSAAPIYPSSPHPSQAPNPNADAAPQEMNQNTGQNDQMPVFRVQVSARTTRAVNYRNRGGSTEVNFKGTELMPDVEGRARVEGKDGRLTIDVELKHLSPANRFGGQYLTYVLWAITPEGRRRTWGRFCRETTARTRWTSRQICRPSE